MTSKDPAQDIYAMFDEVRLDAGYLLITHASMSKMITTIRTELNKKLCAYIAEDRATRPGVALAPTQKMPEMVQSPPDATKSGAITPPAPSPTNESEFPL